MLLCCFREPKKASKATDGRSRKGNRRRQRDCSDDHVAMDEIIASGSDADVAIMSAKPINGNNNRHRRKRSSATSPMDTSSALSSSPPEAGEVMLAPVTFHGQPPSSGRNTRHSVSSYNSERSLSQQFRPPSRDGSDRRDKERAPLARDAKRLMKQRSQESFKLQQQQQSATSIPYIDASPPAKSLLPEATTSTTSTPHHQIGGSNNKSCQNATSTPNLPTTTPVHQPSLARQQQQVPVSMVKKQSDSSLASPNNNNSLLNGSSNQLSRAEERIQGRGMSRSNASYGIQQLLQDQITREERESQARQLEKEVKASVAKVSAAYEERLSATRAEHNLKMQQMLRDKTTAVNNARNTFETELKRQLTTFEKDLHELRCKHNAEVDKMDLQYKMMGKEREERYQEIIAQYAARDQAWQAEKEEVLAEIQRLKEEANRFIAVLSQEEDGEKSDELLSPTKRQSLTREVESLQLVVEMRTAELHKLREERTRHLQQLEELEQTRAQLAKATARVEDLAAQLAEKTELERQLSLEKSQLENFYETESKNKARMSMQVEELQWRIKHNLELPATQLFSPNNWSTTDDDDCSPMSCPANGIPEAKMLKMECHMNNNVTDVWHKDEEAQTRGESLKEDSNKNLDVSMPNKQTRPTSLTGITGHTVSNDSEDSLDGHQDQEEVLQNGKYEEEEDDEEEEEKNDESKNDSDDAGLSDEGLGDITSEASNSPQPPHHDPGTDAFSDTKAKKSSSEPPQKQHKTVCDNENNVEAEEAVTNNNPVSSPCDERVPSRIPFSVKQKHQQTNNM